MAGNFGIYIHKNSDNLHLKLTGDFDGSSAHELINVLQRYSGNTTKVFIHTDALKDVHPFGRNVFHKNLQILNGSRPTMLFTGENAAQLDPTTH